MQKFFKMSCAGNTYLYTFGKKPTNKQLVKFCNSYLGFGSDGVVTIKKRGKNYCMQIFNADASHATFCGNATMSVAKYLFDNGMVTKKQFEIGTGAGQKTVKVLGKNICKRVILKIGKPSFSVSKRLFIHKKALDYSFNLSHNNTTINFVASVVWVGNLHLVVTNFKNNLREMEHIVSAVQNSGLFPNGVNIEFVTFLNGGASAVVYERGSGKTLACGSGCAAIFAVLKKLKMVGESLVVRFEGGRLKTFLRAGEIYLSGVPRYQKLGE